MKIKFKSLINVLTCIYVNPEINHLSESLSRNVSLSKGPLVRLTDGHFIERATSYTCFFVSATDDVTSF